MNYKSALVTGAGGGLGSELSYILAENSDELILMDRKKEFLKPLVSRISKKTKVHVYEADMTNYKSLELILKTISKKHPGLDLIIANAGIDQPVDLMHPDWKKIHNHFAINTMANIVLFSVLVPGMLKNKKGHFVTIASQAALKGFPYESAYCGSKSGIVAFIESARAELTREGVHFTTAFPGFLETPMVKGNAFKVSATITPKVAAEKILDAVKAKKRNLYFPFSSYLGIQILRHLPAALADLLIHTAMKKKKDIF